MKILYLFLAVLIISFSSQAQEEISCDLLPSVTTNSPSKFYLNEITAETFNSKKRVNTNALVLFSNSDSIENILQHKHPKLFKKKNGKYLFKNIDNQVITVRNNLVEDKTYSKYAFKAQFKNYIVVFQEYYEGAMSLLIDTNTNKAYSLPDKPYFITDKLVYSYGLYSGGGTMLTILDIGKNEYISFDFDNIIFESTYNISINLRFKIKCMYSDETKYLEVCRY
ncbi:MAG: hypothetical protein V7719_10070 [Psychroserpens sp.]|uniref:hypothetical protein n=1 Tax=Psychroserpens sp. TaxID=2020870 RepID=UPI0030024D40